MDVVWLEADTVEKLNAIALYEGEPHGRNPGSDLKGALARPKGHYYYEDVDSLYEIAALYAVALAKAHAFRDGNKRTALLAIRAFLRANEIDFDYGPRDEEAVEMMKDIATGAAGREDVAEWVAQNSTSLS